MKKEQANTPIHFYHTIFHDNLSGLRNHKCLICITNNTDISFILTFMQIYKESYLISFPCLQMIKPIRQRNGACGAGGVLGG